MIEKITAIFNSDFTRMIISNGKYGEYHKIIIRPILLQEILQFQFEFFTKTQVFHRNLIRSDAITLVVEIMNDMRQIDVFSATGNRIIKVSKKGKIFDHEVKVVNPAAKSTVLEHNRKKNYILAEGIVIPALIDLGITTAQGTIIKAKYDKFRQINRFIEMVDDVITQEKCDKLNIIDFGCGKSYLTFVLYHYLTVIKNIDVKIVGLDLKVDVINKCNKIRDSYGYENLNFEIGDIQGYKPTFDIDMVISLHACDTATDFALANAINWQAKYILAVPCCQKEVNHSIRNTDDLLLSYGLIKERYSSLITDTLRAKTLELCGYGVQVLEFIDMEHSFKNVLIRAIKRTTPPIVKLSPELIQWFSSLNIEPTLINELVRMGNICKE